MEGERPPPPLDGDGGGAPPGKGHAAGTGAAAGGAAHELFGDPNLGLALMVLALFGLMQSMLAPPCTC